MNINLNEHTAREILGDMIRPDNSLRDEAPYIAWNPQDKFVTIGGSVDFVNLDAVTLGAIAWWMYHKRVNDGGIVG